jgi:hypothetical protein
MKHYLFVAWWMSICGLASAAAPSASLIEAPRKIWDRAPHNAFTDLAYWKGQFICAFREGRGHVSTDGQIRVLSSPDGNQWESAALIALDGYDLRDAGLSITPAGRLMLTGGAAPRRQDNESAPTGTFMAFTRDGHQWTEPKIVVKPGRWLWRVTWHGGRAYGVAYAAPDGRPITTLLAWDDGTVLRPLVRQMFNEGYPTEAVLRFGENGTAYCLQRRDGEPPHNTAFLGVSAAPYFKWQWHDLQMFFGGPNFIQIPSGQWIAAGRLLDNGMARTALAQLDVDEKTLRPILVLPSGGDTSYPGLVWHDDMLWVSYYSSHEGKASIYLAKVRIE